MKKNSIFVSVASYRDNVCFDTIKSLFGMAKYPENIFIGICQQNKEEDYDCIEHIEEKWKKNINMYVYENICIYISAIVKLSPKINFLSFII